jgi:hypothetical protein
MTRSRDEIMRELEGAGTSLADVERTRDKLKAKIASLRTELAAQSPTANFAWASPPEASAPQTLDPADKVRLFRSLFRGRADVFPIRRISRREVWNNLRLYAQISA